MPSIADQVATIEHDLAAALALIDTLNAANAALTSANTGLCNENDALQLEVNDMKRYVDDTRAMAEQLASGALDMLRASRRQVGQPAEVIAFAPKRDPKATIREGINALIDADPRFTQTKVDPSPAGVDLEAAEGDSGDEQPVTTVEAEVDGTLKEMGATPTPAQRSDIIAAVEARNRTWPPINEFAVKSLEPIKVEHGKDASGEVMPIFLTRDRTYGAQAGVLG